MPVTMNLTLPLETSRLRLRPLTIEDAGALKNVLGDPKVMYAWESPFTEAEILEWIQKNIMRYDRDGAGYMAAELKSDGSLVGVMGPLIESIDGRDYMGVAYILGAPYWGMGYAYEAVSKIIERIFTEAHLEMVVADIRPENLPSKSLAERLGMKVIGEHTKIYKGITMPHLIYALHNHL